MLKIGTGDILIEAPQNPKHFWTLRKFHPRGGSEKFGIDYISKIIAMNEANEIAKKEKVDVYTFSNKKYLLVFYHSIGEKPNPFGINYEQIG